MGSCFYCQAQALTSARCRVYLEQALDIQSPAQQGASAGDEAIFSPLHFIRRIYFVYANRLPTISGSLQKEERKWAPSQLWLIPDGTLRHLCKSKREQQPHLKTSCSLYCRAEWLAAGGGPWACGCFGVHRGSGKWPWCEWDLAVTGTGAAWWSLGM